MAWMWLRCGSDVDRIECYSDVILLWLGYGADDSSDVVQKVCQKLRASSFQHCRGTSTTIPQAGQPQTLSCPLWSAPSPSNAWGFPCKFVAATFTRSDVQKGLLSQNVTNSFFKPRQVGLGRVGADRWERNSPTLTENSSSIFIDYFQVWAYSLGGAFLLTVGASLLTAELLRLQFAKVLIACTFPLQGKSSIESKKAKIASKKSSNCK